MQSSSKLPLIPEVRTHHDARRSSGRPWVVLDGSGPGQHQSPVPWGLPGVTQLPPDPGLLKQVSQPLQQSPYPHRYQPYGFQRHRMQFTIHDINKCLYGKQELRVVQVDPKIATNGVGTKSNSSNADDKNKPAKWCDMCQEIRFGECPQHGPLPSLRPTVTLPGPKSYAISTFPDEVGLCISTLPAAGYGVFARHFIPMGTWIGPYEGKKIPVEEGMKQISQGDAPFLWEIYEGYRLSHFLDASDENASSWMRFIQCARHTGEQNLFVFQYYGSIYYRAFKDIPVGSELLVWYDDKYPQYFGMPYDIRDMSSYSMESIQAPMEISKMPDFESNRHRHTESGRPHPSTSYIHNGKMIPPTGKMVPTSLSLSARERNEPPRIPQDGNIRRQTMHNHTSSIFQTPPAQPPTLIQAPSIMDTRLGHSSTYSAANRIQSQSHPSLPIGHSPRQNFINPVFARDGVHSPNMQRSTSADDIRKKSAKLNSEKHERDSMESVPAEHHSHPPPGVLLPQVNPAQRATLHYNTSNTFVFSSKHPPAVMSVAPLVMDHSKTKMENVKSDSEVNHERERQALEREKIARQPERMALEMSPDRGRIVQDKSIHDNHIMPREPWDILRCNGCGQSFQTKSLLEKHKCGSEAAKPYQCGRCQLSFPEARHLQEHMVMHNSDRPFKCGVCSRSFSGATTLTNHMRMHVNNGTVNEKNINADMHSSSLDCQKCGKRFLQQDDFIKHMSTPGLCIGNVKL